MWQQRAPQHRFLPGTRPSTWNNVRAGRSAAIAVRSVCGRLMAIRRTAWSGTLCLIGMKDESAFFATSALDGFIILIMSRRSWDLTTRLLSGPTSDLSSLQTCFRHISPSAGVAMLPRHSGMNFRNWSCTAIGEDGLEQQSKEEVTQMFEQELEMEEREA